MKELYTYTSSEFGDVRVLDLNDMPWFVGKDAAEAVGYGHAGNALRLHVDDEDKKLHPVTGSKRDMVIINEAGLYSLIFASKLQRAKQFKHWVTTEILPAFRRFGYNSTENIKNRSALGDSSINTEPEEYNLEPKERLKLATLIATAPNERLGAIKQVIQPMFDEELIIGEFNILPTEAINKDKVIGAAYELANKLLNEKIAIEQDDEYLIPSNDFGKAFKTIGRKRALQILKDEGLLRVENKRDEYTVRAYKDGKRSRYVALKKSQQTSDTENSTEKE